MIPAPFAVVVWIISMSIMPVSQAAFLSYAVKKKKGGEFPAFLDYSALTS
jgi:hypothetical protein